jgi:hypothetical protein
MKRYVNGRWDNSVLVEEENPNNHSKFFKKDLNAFGFFYWIYKYILEY